MWFRRLFTYSLSLFITVVVLHVLRFQIVIVTRPFAVKQGMRQHSAVVRHTPAKHRPYESPYPRLTGHVHAHEILGPFWRIYEPKWPVRINGVESIHCIETGGRRVTVWGEEHIPSKSCRVCKMPECGSPVSWFQLMSGPTTILAEAVPISTHSSKIAMSSTLVKLVSNINRNGELFISGRSDNESIVLYGLDPRYAIDILLGSYRSILTDTLMASIFNFLLVQDEDSLDSFWKDRSEAKDISVFEYEDRFTDAVAKCVKWFNDNVLKADSYIFTSEYAYQLVRYIIQKHYRDYIVNSYTMLSEYQPFNSFGELWDTLARPWLSMLDTVLIYATINPIDNNRDIHIVCGEGHVSAIVETLKDLANAKVVYSIESRFGACIELRPDEPAYRTNQIINGTFVISTP